MMYESTKSIVHETNALSRALNKYYCIAHMSAIPFSHGHLEIGTRLWNLVLLIRYKRRVLVLVLREVLAATLQTHVVNK